jgi:hypothetical protein
MHLTNSPTSFFEIAAIYAPSFSLGNWLARYAEHEPDFVDGYLAAVSGIERAPESGPTIEKFARRGAGSTEREFPSP